MEGCVGLDGVGEGDYGDLGVEWLETGQVRQRVDNACMSVRMHRNTYEKQPFWQQALEGGEV